MTSVVRASFLISIIFLSACSSDEISNYSGEIYGTSYIIKTTGKPSNDLKEKIDESLIGGAIIRMDDKQLDASVSSEIKELRKIFNKNLYLQDF